MIKEHFQHPSVQNSIQEKLQPRKTCKFLTDSDQRLKSTCDQSHFHNTGGVMRCDRSTMLLSKKKYILTVI